MQRVFLNRRVRNGDKNLNPFFEVRRDRLTNADGEYVGFDALINTDLKKTMSVVGQQYHMVPHKQASEVVHDFLSDAGMNFETKSVQTANNGAQYFEVIQFPDYKFDVIPKGKDTSRDNSGTVDQYIPTITVRSSYDKSFPTQFIYGAYRFVCTNGLMVGSTINRLSIRHNQELIVDKVREQFKMDLESTISNLKIRLPVLNQIDAQPYVEEFLFDKSLPVRFKKDILDLAATAIICNYDIIKSEKTQREKMVLESVQTELSAYAFMNIMTQVISHNMKNAARQQAMFRRVSKAFAV